MKAIEFVTPLEVSFAVDGRELTVTPVTVGQLPKLLQWLDPLFDDLMSLGDEPQLDDLFGLVIAHGEPVLKAVALAARVDEPWVAQLLPDRLAALMAVLLEVNGDFFRRAMPLISTHLVHLRQAVVPGAPAPAAAPASPGPTPSGG
jgi:hypothetical protein